MKNQYKISGMGCGSCSNYIEKILGKVEGVTKVDVKLNERSAQIEMDNGIPLETFKAALAKCGGNYQIEAL